MRSRGMATTLCDSLSATESRSSWSCRIRWSLRRRTCRPSPEAKPPRDENRTGRPRHCGRPMLCSSALLLTGEFVERGLGLGQPFVARGERGLGVVDLALLAGGAGALQLLLELRDRGLQLAHGGLGAGLGFGVGPRPLGLLGVGDRALDVTQGALEPRLGVPGDRADLLPARLDAAQRLASRLEVRDRQQLLRLDQQLLLAGLVLPETRVALVQVGVARREEGVLRALEPLPELVLDLALRPARRLPLLHQVAETLRGARPIGRIGEALGLLDQRLLARAHLLALGVQLREVGLAALGEGGAGRAEPGPQLVV